MSTTVSALRLKVKWAEEHFENFKVRSLGRNRPEHTAQTLGFHYDRNGQRIVVTPHHFLEPQLEWGLALGDVLHQLRATLDHLLYAIAIGHRPLTRKEEWNLHFPIFKDATDFNADKRVCKLWDGSMNYWQSVIGGAAFTAVKLTQPYERYKADPTSDPLWHLHKLDNIDKHRTILVLDNRASVSGTARSATMEMPFDVIKEPVKPGADFLSIDWPIDEEPTEVEVQRFLAHVVLTGTGVCDNLRIYPLVRNVIDAVKGVITDFESKSLI